MIKIVSHFILLPLLLLLLLLLLIIIIIIKLLPCQNHHHVDVTAILTFFKHKHVKSPPCYIDVKNMHLPPGLEPRSLECRSNALTSKLRRHDEETCSTHPSTIFMLTDINPHVKITNVSTCLNHHYVNMF